MVEQTDIMAARHHGRKNRQGHVPAQAQSGWEMHGTSIGKQGLVRRSLKRARGAGSRT